MVLLNVFSSSPLEAISRIFTQGKRCTFAILSFALLPLFPARAVPASNSIPSLHLRVVVNSDRDGAVQPDDTLTLREAIAVVNGTLSLEDLSVAESKQVELLSAESPSRLEFNLPPQQTTIRLNSVLPPLVSPGLVVDGATQPGYDASATMPTPIVALTPAEGAVVFRGLTVLADGITIRGLSLYGFTAPHQNTAAAPPADIFISTRQAATSGQPEFDRYLEEVNAQKTPPKDVAIEHNWLGVSPDGQMPTITSAFGVSVFDSLGTTIQQNRIAYHDGSAVITGIRAENLQVSQNLIVNNGIAGMPDAIRLEGRINNTQIDSNFISDNAGSAVFFFKSQGAATIRENQIQGNGRRFHRAAIYLMGNDHQIINNQISNQRGSGVVVAAYPQSTRNIIQNNRFAALEGLSIDLNAQQNVGVRDYQIGDGPNPLRNSPNRRKETGNGAIDAPRFLSPEFLLRGDRVNIDGIANPGSLVEIYRVTEEGNLYGPLSEPLVTVTADREGRFGVTLRNLRSGDKVSAIATHPEYGTSEPALNAVVRTIESPSLR